VKLIVCGISDGKTCVLEEVVDTPSDDRLSMQTIFEMKLDSLPPRPPGLGDLVDLPVAPGTMKWFWSRGEPNGYWDMHHTDTIDCHTIVSGSIDLILDDGTHHLEAGDSAVVSGIDHAWQVGPDGCFSSILIFGTPKPTA